jgi:hypothetical protein
MTTESAAVAEDDEAAVPVVAEDDEAGVPVVAEDDEAGAAGVPVVAEDDEAGAAGVPVVASGIGAVRVAARAWPAAETPITQAPAIMAAVRIACRPRAVRTAG